MDPQGTSEKQCRICLDGEDSSLGRLIRPCLCKGTISYVHIKCLQLWMNSSANKSSFFACPQCKYHYRYSRTRAFGIATNPVIVGAVSSIFFVALVLSSSFVTTYFMNALDEPSTSSWYYSSYFVSPLEVGHDLIRAAYRILTDQDVMLDDNIFARTSLGSRNAAAAKSALPVPRPPPGLIKRLFQRFILGLPVVGAGSLVHLLLSVHMLAPVHWIARYRGNRSRRGNNRDVAALVIILLLVFGAARALYKVYQLTENISKRLLLRAEDAILEVN